MSEMSGEGQAPTVKLTDTAEPNTETSNGFKSMSEYLVKSAVREALGRADLLNANEDVLPTAEKARLEAIRLKTAEIRSRMDALLDRQLASVYSLQRGRENGQISGTEVQEEALLTSITGVAKEADNFVDTIHATLDEGTRLAAELSYDKKTGLYILDAVSKDTGAMINKWLQRDESAKDDENNKDGLVSLRQVRVKINDMMLFHFGNQNLNTEGFDRRVRTLSRGHIAMARYLATDETDAYKPFKPGEVEADEGIQQYFPPGSEERAYLDHLKGKIKTYPFRVNGGGGDEFGVGYFLTSDATEEDFLAAEALSDRIYRSTTLAKDVAVMRPDTQRQLTTEEVANREKFYIPGFYNAINNLRVSPDESLGVTPAEAYYINKVKDTIRSHFMADAGFKAQMIDPRVEVTADYAEVRLQNGEKGEVPTLDDAMIGFFFGKDSYGNQLKDENGVALEGFFTADGELNKFAIAEYARTLAEKARPYITKRNITDEKVLQEIMGQLVTTDIADRFYKLINAWVNDYGKPAKKQAVAADAFGPNGDPYGRMRIAATEVSGRKFAEFSNESNLNIMRDLVAQYDAVGDDIIQNGVTENNRHLVGVVVELDTLKSQYLRGIDDEVIATSRKRTSDASRRFGPQSSEYGGELQRHSDVITRSTTLDLDRNERTARLKEAYDQVNSL